MSTGKIFAGIVCGVVAALFWLTYVSEWESATISPEPADGVQQETSPDRVILQTESSTDVLWPVPSRREPSNGPVQSVDTEMTSGEIDQTLREDVSPDVAPIEEPAMGEEMKYSFDDSEEGTVDGQASPNQVAANLDARFAAEAYDSGWAGKTEAKLNQLFVGDRLEGNQLAAAVCRTSLCRIEVTHSDQGAEQRFLAEFSSSGQFVSDDTSGFYHRRVDYNGIAHTVFFWARVGHQLTEHIEEHFGQIVVDVLHFARGQQAIVELLDAGGVV